MTGTLPEADPPPAASPRPPSQAVIIQPHDATCFIHGGSTLLVLLSYSDSSGKEVPSRDRQTRCLLVSAERLSRSHANQTSISKN